MSTTTDHHHLTVTIDMGGDLHWSITCTAPEGATCRSWCDEGCEHFTPEHDSHIMKDQGTCGLTPWFEESVSIPGMYKGIAQPLRSGPVDLWVSDEQAGWEYADQAAPEEDHRLEGLRLALSSAQDRAETAENGEGER